MEVKYLENTKKSLTESIIKTDILGETFEIGIFNKKGKVEFSTVIFDKNKKFIFIKTNKNTEIKINYNDVISFTKDNSFNFKKIQEENSYFESCKFYNNS